MLAQVSPDTGTTTFTFDPASNLATKTDARSIQATYSYDAINRVTQITYPDETVTFAYDSCTNGVGRLCSIADRSGTTTLAYDLWGRVTSKSQTAGTLTQTMGYAYNASGQLTTITTPSGRTVVYGYSNNRPVSIAVNGMDVLTSVFYEPFGPNGGWKWGNSTVSVPNTHTRIFDKDFRLTRVTSDLPTSGTQPYFDKQVGWDYQGRVASITDVANSALSATYGFDALDRLTSASQGTNSWGFTYNGIGDRLTSTVNAATTNYAYFTSTHRLQTLSGAQSKSYAFDNAGNTTSDGSTTWTYAGNNRPLSAGSLNVLINALGQRVKKDNGSTTTRFVYDEAGRLWGEYDATGTMIQETVWLDDLPVASLRPNGSGTDIFYVHPDHLGTPRAATRPSDNQFTWKWDNTEPFGDSAPDQNPSGLGVFSFNLRFPGQYYDQETGKHYNYFRDYDPSLGRYIESDPIGLRGGINTFGYAEANALLYVDPLGLQASRLCPICRGGGVGGGGGGSGSSSGPTGFGPWDRQIRDDTRSWSSPLMSQSNGGGGDDSAIGSAPVPPFPGLKDLSECTAGRRMVEPATGKQYKGGMSYQQEYICPCGQITRHTIVVNNVVVHDHFRPGPPKPGGD
jgi:RHS repeat-associated protein